MSRTPWRTGAILALAVAAVEVWSVPVSRAAPVAKADAPLIWVEGESATDKHVYPNAGLDATDHDELSGGAWISSFAEIGVPAGTVGYTVQVPTAGKYHLWARANPRGTGLAFRVDTAQWTEVDGQIWQAEDKAAHDTWVRDSRQRQRQKLEPLPEPQPRIVDLRPASLDAAPGFRDLGWINLGLFDLTAGAHSIGFRLGGTDEKIKQFNALDCFVLTTGTFVPYAKFKPGQTWPDIVALDPKDSWAFEPKTDALSADAVLDLRHLNEKVAGEHGFIKQSPDGMDFVRGDGTPIRFWGGSDYTQRDLDVAGVTTHGEFLAKRGVNIVRWHGSLVPGPGSKITDVDKKELDEAFKLVAGMKKAGIYTILSPYWGESAKAQESWNIGVSGSLAGLVYFYPPLQEGYKAWLKALYTTVNPYTGVALKDDPAVATIQLQNEDSMLFWTMSGLKGAPRTVLRQQYGAWLLKKYGSFDKVKQRWQGWDAGEKDDWDNGQPGLAIVWEFTRDALRQKGNIPGHNERMADQLEFYTETMHTFNADMEKYLHDDLGCKQLVNAGNWRSVDQALVDDAERWSYTANEVLGQNHYYGGQHKGINVGWQILANQYFTDPSATLDPAELPVNVKQAVGHPFIIPESLWVPPMMHQSEGPLMIAAQTSLTGVDTFYWFADGVPEWQPVGNKWTYATPMLLGQFPAAALLYREGYVERGRPVVEEQRSLENIWQHKMPVIAESTAWDPNRDQGDLPTDSAVKTTVDPLAFLVGPVWVKYGGDPAQTKVIDLQPYIDRAKKIVTSVTGQIRDDFGAGVYTVNAPQAQGAAGFLKKAGPITLQDVTIACENTYATIAVVPLDGQPIAASHQVLLQAGTVCRATGFEARPAKFGADGKLVDGFRILATGQAPWRVENTHATVTIRNPSLTRATQLDVNGMRAGAVTLKKVAGGVEVQMPAAALYVVVE